jgi:hypothetical protein
VSWPIHQPSFQEKSWLSWLSSVLLHRMLPQLDHDCFFKNRFQFIIHISSNDLFIRSRILRAPTIPTPPTHVYIAQNKTWST